MDIYVYKPHGSHCNLGVDKLVAEPRHLSYYSQPEAGRAVGGLQTSDVWSDGQTGWRIRWIDEGETGGTYRVGCA